MQDDLLNAHHSVEETLLYAAKVWGHFAQLWLWGDCWNRRLCKVWRGMCIHLPEACLLTPCSFPCQQLRQPPETSVEKRVERIEEVIEACSLQHCRHTLVGSPLRKGISGGEFD